MNTSKSRRSRWRTNLLVALAGTLVALLLAWGVGEMYVRMTRPYVTPDTLRAASLEYEATMFSRHAFPRMVQKKQLGTTIVEINERGYRGRSFAVPKPAGVVRVVVLGGSAAFDIYAAEGRDWPRLTETRLAALGAPRVPRVEIVNAATPGHATWDALGRLYAEIWMFEPDYVVVYEAWNDIKYFAWLTPERSLLRGYRPATAAPEGEGLLVSNPLLYYSGPLDRLLGRSQLYQSLRSRYWSWQLWMVGPEGAVRVGGDGTDGARPRANSDTYGPWGPRQYELNLRLIADAARDIGATPVFVTQARLVSPSNDEAERKRIGYHYVNLSHASLVRAFADADRAVRAAAAAEGVRVLDVGTRLGGQSALYVDHVHTTPAGSEAIADLVAPFLAEVMRAR